MDADAKYESLLYAVREAYTQHARLTAFAPFPEDVQRQVITPYHCNCADYLRDETALFSDRYQDLQDAIVKTGPVAHWRETYKDTDIGQDFMDRFGCYCIIGDGGPFQSSAIRLYMVYMPPHLDYPWHHHPAEEIYMVVSGSAVFRRRNCPDEVLTSGDTSFHESNQPHAMETLEKPVLCLVAWRDDFETLPVLTPSS